MKRIRIAMSLLGVLLLVAAPARAQMQAMPVYFAPKGGIGITLDGDYGEAANTKIDDIAEINHPSMFGARAYVGLPFVTVGLGVGTYDSKVVGVGSATQFMGSASLKVFGSPLVPIAVSLQAGAGMLNEGSGAAATKTLSVPIGLGLALNIPTPGASVEPWLGGRLNLRSVTAGTNSASRIGPGLSGGLNMGLPIGLGLHVALDWSSYAAKASSTILTERSKVEQLTVGIGVHYMIKLPGIGVPLVPGV